MVVSGSYPYDPNGTVGHCSLVNHDYGMAGAQVELGTSLLGGYLFPFCFPPRASRNAQFTSWQNSLNKRIRDY